MSTLYNNLLVEPIYNTLVAMFNIFPAADAGLAIVFITILVRFALYPLSKKAVKAQIEMQNIAPELEKIKEKYKNNKEEQARQTLALYKNKGVNPFSGILVLLIQLPVIFALYHIFVSTGFPDIDTDLLYPFINQPNEVSAIFLGINLTQKSVLLALLAAITTYFQIKLSISGSKKPNTNSQSFGDDLAKNMQMQMKYFFPAMVFFIAYTISGVIALYWLTTNLFTIGQEIFVRKKLKVLAQGTKG